MNEEEKYLFDKLEARVTSLEKRLNELLSFFRRAKIQDADMKEKTYKALRAKTNLSQESLLVVLETYFLESRRSDFHIINHASKELGIKTRSEKAKEKRRKKRANRKTQANEEQSSKSLNKKDEIVS